MASVKGASSWLGRPTVRPEHERDLEVAAAHHEFDGKRPREEAEQQAYDDYVKRHRIRSAAHHLHGMRVAQAAGDQKAAEDHAGMYKLHMKALGHDSYDRPPPEIVSAAQVEPPKVYRFKPHEGDVFAVSDHKDAEVEKAELADRLVTLKKAGELILGMDAAAKAIRKRKQKTCRCDGMTFPHRHTSKGCRHHVSA